MTFVLPSHHVKRIHFLGIGGSGMSGIAEVLVNQGYQISGSDLKQTAVTERLQSLGAEIYIGHNNKQVLDADLVVTSTAIQADNPEFKLAKSKKIPIVPRARMLADLMRFHYGIAVAGTHGKTTTTSLIASVLAEGGLDPTFVIGGLLQSAGANARMGKSQYFVVEADESDASFLYLHPQVAVVTNIDMDHLSTYGNDSNKLRATFLEFLDSLPFNGLTILCIDDPIIQIDLAEISKPTFTYGFNPDADYVISEFTQKALVSRFKVSSVADNKTYPIKLNLPGKHNVLNAAAAFIVGLHCGVDEHKIQCALENFAGVGRRFQVYGTINLAGKNVILVDDYGHHPQEIQVTLQAARQAWPENRLVLVFQPHRYSRTQALFKEFVNVLSHYDQLVLLDIYSAGESALPGVTGEILYEAIKKKSKEPPIFVKNLEEVPATLANILQSGDILLTQGAGSVGGIPKQLLNHQ